MKLFDRFFKKPKPVAATRLFSPDEVPDSLETLEASLERLRRFQPLVRNQDALEELISYEMSFAERALTDPAYSAEQAQFFRGAFWLAKQIGQKLVSLNDEIARKDDELTKLKKKPENVVGR